MLYTIIINYNEQGRKISKTNGYTFNVEVNYKLTDDQVKDLVYKEVPKELISDYNISESDFGSLNVGDIVVLTQSTTYSYGVDHSVDYKKVIEITDTYIVIEDYKNKFDFTGKEISRKKKDIAYITLPTEVQLQSYNEHIKRNELIEKIYSYINDGYILEMLPTDELETICEILTIH